MVKARMKDLGVINTWKSWNYDNGSELQAGGCVEKQQQDET